MTSVLKFLQRRAADVQVALMAAMFAAFIVQIGSRYIFNAPTDWTHELIMICWIWLIFWGSAFMLKDEDHVKFDVLYNLGGEKARRAMALITAAVFAVAIAFSVPATWDFISFKAIRSTDVLGIRFDIVFFCYLIFLAGTIAHYALRAWRLMRGDSLSTLEKEESL